MVVILYGTDVHVFYPEVVSQDDPDQSERSEDSLIAYTWKSVIDQVEAGNPNPDRDIVLRCPMTKVRNPNPDSDIVLCPMTKVHVGLHMNAAL